MINYGKKEIGKGYLGYYKTKQHENLGYPNYDVIKAMNTSTEKVSHRRSVMDVNIKKMKPRDDRLYQESYFNENDFRNNIVLENTKAERAEEILAKRERKRQ